LYYNLAMALDSPNRDRDAILNAMAKEYPNAVDKKRISKLSRKAPLKLPAITQWMEKLGIGTKWLAKVPSELKNRSTPSAPATSATVPQVPHIINPDSVDSNDPETASSADHIIWAGSRFGPQPNPYKVYDDNRIPEWEPVTDPAEKRYDPPFKAANNNSHFRKPPPINPTTHMGRVLPFLFRPTLFR